MIEKIGDGQRSGKSADNPFPGHPGGKKNRCGDQDNIDGSAHVGLRQNQADEDEHRARGRKDGLEQILFAEFHGRFIAALLVEEPRKIKNDGELGQFGWLNANGAIADPAMRFVRFVQEQSSDQKQQDEAHARIDNRGLAKAAVVRTHQGEHSQETEGQPDGLANEKIIGVGVFTFGGDGGGAENHHGAHQAKHERHAKQPTIHFETSRHVRSPFSGSRARGLRFELLD